MSNSVRSAVVSRQTRFTLIDATIWIINLDRFLELFEGFRRFEHLNGSIEMELRLNNFQPKHFYDDLDRKRQF